MRLTALPTAYFFAFVAAGSAHAAPAANGGDDRIVEGEVVHSESRWSGSSIITESVIRRSDGTRVTVRQLGGRVDGIRMHVFHAPPVLSSGDYAAVVTAEGRTATGQLVATVRELTDPVVRLPFVRTVNDNNTPMKWENSCAFITFDAAGTADLAGDTEFTVLSSVLDEWQSNTADCSYMRFQLTEPEASEVGLDGVNLIKFRDDQWGRPAIDDMPAESYDPAAAGLTTLFFVDDPASARDGAIVDADIEFNAVHFAISHRGVTEAPSSLCNSDLANTATHEFGHLLGLDHTCWDGGDFRPVNHNGTQVQRCIPEANLPASVTEATMYNFQACDETKKATVESDDVAGICAAYPALADPNDCSPVDVGGGGCCSVASMRTETLGGGAMLLGLALAGLLRGSSRRRRSRRPRYSAPA